MRYMRLLLLGLLVLAAMFSAAQAARDSVEADDRPPADAQAGRPTGEVDRGKGPRAGDIIPGRYIVRLKEGASPKALAARHGLRPQVVYEAAVKGFAGPLSERDVERLRADPNVVSIEPDTIVTADDQTLPTGVDRIDADLHTVAKIDGIDDALDVDIAVLDTGIQPDHPDLRVAGGATFLGESCDGDSWADDNGHGTHVAGTAAALDNDIGVVGAAPGARLWAVKVLDSSGTGSASCVIAGIDWVTANADTIEVANMSLGGPTSKCDAIANSAAAGVVYAVSAGNSAQDVGSHSPANCPDVLTTSAIADFDGKPGALSPQTYSGSCTFTGDDVFACFGNYGPLVEIAAPGVKILSTDKGSGYATGSGTSMASPHVAGAAALDIVVNGKPTDAAGAAAVRSRVVASGAPQNSDLGFSGDPDSYAEPLLYLWSPDEHDVAVISVSAPATLAQGDQAPVTVLVANRGGSSETSSVSLAASDGAVSASPQTVTLDAHTVTTLTFTWDTAGLAAGDYTLTATADTVPGETYTVDNTASTVVSIRHDVAVTEISTPSFIEAGDVVSVDVSAANPGNFSETFQVSLAASGGTVSDSPQPATLAPGASTTLTFTWDTTGLAAPADYILTATASTVPGETDTTNNSSEVTVRLAGHDVAVTAMNAPAVVVEGDTVSVGVTARNVGDHTETFSVSLTASGGAVGDSPQSVNLAAGAWTTLAFTWDTTGLAPGDYTLTATASTVPGETNTADNSRSTGVTVRLPEHDVAVTAIDAPSAAVEGDSLWVGVTVSNPGTFSEAFEVSLAASGGNVSGSPQSVTLQAGAFTRLTFAWDTAGAGPGTHTLTATAATVPGEANSADNTLAKSLPVIASPDFVVNSALDPGSGVCDAAECTLREAITAANASPGAQVIWFDISPGGPQTITPLSRLPEITGPLVIDATTQPGYAGSPIIELDGSSAGGGYGVNITAGSSTVKGLVINRFAGSLINLSINGGNIIQGNYVGTDVSGTWGMGSSGANGIQLLSVSSNVIGGRMAGEGNVIAGNGGKGVLIWGGDATGNVLEGNYIGTTADGISALGNGFSGVFLQYAAHNLIGGTAAGAGNVISANGSTGVLIWYSEATGNQVQGNLIGTDVTGTAALGNANQGVFLNKGAADNTIGGTTPGARNVISANGSLYTRAGVGMANSASRNVVQGNYIGTDITGTVGLGNAGGGRFNRD